MESVYKYRNRISATDIHIVIQLMSFLLILFLEHVETNKYWVFEKPADATL